jgi:thiamine-monophosphate kinase
VLAGGDTTEGDSIVISVTALGSLAGRAPITRGGARPGDRIAVCGRLGWAAAGLAVLGRGFRSPKALVDAHRYPLIDYTAGARAAQAGARAMIDVSDGLIADLGHVAQASGVDIELRTEGNAAFSVPEPMQAAAAAYNVDARGWMLTGGDDHALVAAFPPEGDLPEGFIEIGNARARTSDGPVVEVDGELWGDLAGDLGGQGQGGFVHFA